VTVSADSRASIPAADGARVTITPGLRMSGLELANLTRDFGSVRAVDSVDLTVPNGRFVCILGPSGCGKTTLLRMIAGLDLPTAGSIRLDGEDITRIQTHKRNLGMVFQSLALFPHLTVGENIAYPLRIRGRSRSEQRRRVDELLTLVHLTGLQGRAISQLSGGQRQRVAIARALAVSPRLFLLDEPLSALDAKLREAMQVELRQLQQKLGITTIVVTHDQREAMTMADTVIVMKGGEIRQAASPAEIYRRPADTFVADFIGSTNLLPLTRERGIATLLGRPSPVDLPVGVTSATVSVRPEDVQVTAPWVDMPTGVVSFVRVLGGTVEYFVDVAGTPIIAVTAVRSGPEISVGAKVGVRVVPSGCVVLAR
jgi:putative spermidine/putrescine transport system ATP-binding protein